MISRRALLATAAALEPWNIHRGQRATSYPDKP